MTESRRRGACPGLSAPMATGDGLLVRLMPAAPVPLAAMAGLCEAARRHGNGTIEVTARGSLQVRGLTPDSAPLFAAAVGELRIAAQEGVPVIAGFDGSAVDLLAAELRHAIANARLALSPKVSVVVDGDGPLHLDGLSADVRLRLAGSEQGLRFHLGIGGDGASTIWLGNVALKHVTGAILSILTVFAAHGPTTRAVDILDREGIAAFHAIPAVDLAPGPPPRTPAEMVSLHAMRDGSVALGIGLSFGHTLAGALAELVRVAARHSARAVRSTPDRALLLTGVPARDAHHLAESAEGLGFVIRADDPRRRIAACPGAPACASGMIPSRAIASTLAQAVASKLRPEHNGIVVHISGCPKGCAHPLPAALTVVGTPQGCGVVRGGSAGETPHHYVDATHIADEIRCLAANPKASHG